MKCSKFTLWPLCYLALLFPLFLSADVVHLKNGQKLQGKVVAEGKDWIELKVPFGKIRLEKSRIRKIVRQQGNEELRQARYLRNVMALEASLEKLKSLWRTSPNDEVKRELAKTYQLLIERALEQKNLSQALEYCQEGRKLLPDSELLERSAKKLKKLEAHLVELLKKGSELYRQKDYLEAAQIYEKVLSYLPELLSKLSPLIASCYSYLGQQAFQEKKYQKAVDLLIKALSYKPRKAAYVENLLVFSVLRQTNDWLKEARFQRALKLLQKGLHYAPASRRILFFLGFTYRRMGKVEKTIEYYCRVLRIPPPPTPQIDLNKLEAKAAEVARIRLVSSQEEQQLLARVESRDWQVLKSGHFHIYHKNRYVGTKALQVLEHFYRYWRERLPILQAKRLPIPCQVYIFPTKEEFVEAANVSWQAGITIYRSRGGRLAVLKILTYQQAPALFQSVLPHELGHVLHALVVNFTSLPLWVKEGWATQFEYSYRKRYLHWKVREALAQKREIPLKELVNLHRYPSSKEKIELLYAQSYSLIAFLLKKRGWQGLVGLLEGLTRRQSISALLEHYQYPNWQSLEREWRLFASGE